jgi:hypothetical protein
MLMPTCPHCGETYIIAIVDDLKKIRDGDKHPCCKEDFNPKEQKGIRNIITQWEESLHNKN